MPERTHGGEVEHRQEEREAPDPERAGKEAEEHPRKERPRKERMVCGPLREPVNRGEYGQDYDRSDYVELPESLLKPFCKQR